MKEIYIIAVFALLSRIKNSPSITSDHWVSLTFSSKIVDINHLRLSPISNFDKEKITVNLRHIGFEFNILELNFRKVVLEMFIDGAKAIVSIPLRAIISVEVFSEVHGIPSMLVSFTRNPQDLSDVDPSKIDVSDFVEFQKLSKKSLENQGVIRFEDIKNE